MIEQNILEPIAEINLFAIRLFSVILSQLWSDNLNEVNQYNDIKLLRRIFKIFFTKF